MDADYALAQLQPLLVTFTAEVAAAVKEGRSTDSIENEFGRQMADLIVMVFDVHRADRVAAINRVNDLLESNNRLLMDRRKAIEDLEDMKATLRTLSK